MLILLPLPVTLLDMVKDDGERLELLAGGGGDCSDRENLKDKTEIRREQRFLS